MTLDTRELYQEVILDHNRSPRNFRVIEDASSHADGNNPLCGDTVSIDLTMNGEVIEDVAFQGAGCAISTASASLMTELIKGKTRTEALSLFGQFRDLVTGSHEMSEPGKLAVFAGVKDYPTRVKCATLAWHTLKAAIEGTHNTITTE
jgi:nitrogen fixation protein NifU and related proteins